MARSDNYPGMIVRKLNDRKEHNARFFVLSNNRLAIEHFVRTWQLELWLNSKFPFLGHQSVKEWQEFLWNLRTTALVTCVTLRFQHRMSNNQNRIAALE